MIGDGMTGQVEVRLTDGGSETIEADSWFGTERGGLDVLKTSDSTSGTVVATFAPGQWSFVSKVTAENLSVGDLTVDVTDVTDGLADLCDRARAEQADDLGASDDQIKVSVADIARVLRGETRPVCSVCGEFTDNQGMCPGCVPVEANRCC